MKTVLATRYVTPLREGGSLPAIVEADDCGLYVVKFRGAGHGARALIAELVTGELPRHAGLPVPERRSSISTTRECGPSTRMRSWPPSRNTWPPFRGSARARAAVVRSASFPNASAGTGSWPRAAP